MDKEVKEVMEDLRKRAAAQVMKHLTSEDLIKRYKNSEAIRALWDTVTGKGVVTIEMVERFAALIAVAERMLIRLEVEEEVAAREREACAKVFQLLVQKFIEREREACAQLAENGLLGLTIAKAIRARGEQ